MREVSGRLITRLLHPRPACVVVASSKEGKINGCTVAWTTPVNIDPPVVAISLAYKRLTYQYIKETSEFTINVLPRNMVNAVHYVGSASGKDVEDKLSVAGFKLRKSKKVKPPGIKGALAILECVVKDEVRYPDHSLIVAEVVHAEADEQCFTTLFSESAEVLLHVGSDVYAVPSKYLRAKE
ncbi:MAG: flavin reductase family protein [Desulfurococcales archaeon]|nr:flavin reductase family protein [Desulfurococcales archaeon]